MPSLGCDDLMLGWCGPSPTPSTTMRWVLSKEMVGLIEHVRSNRQPERFRHLQIDRELDLRVDFHRKLCRMCASENLVDEAGRLPAREIGVRPKADEGPALNPVHVGRKHGRDPLLGGRREDEARNI